MQNKELSKTFHWIYIDMISSSHPTLFTKKQVAKLIFLNKMIGRTKTFSGLKPQSDMVQMTGDGLVIGFSENPEKPLRLAEELHKEISNYNKGKKIRDKIQIRIGIDTGPVYFIKDVTGKLTFWGEGVIMAKRIMDLGESMHVLTSERFAKDVGRLSHDYEKTIHRLGNYWTKHSEKLSICNVYGKNWGNKNSPYIDDRRKLSSVFDKVSIPFLKIKIDVLDPQNMLVHNTWIWDEINISNELIDFVQWGIDTDIPTKLSDLNVKLKDENDKKMDITTIALNLPKKKSIVAKLKNPIRPNQGRRFKMEYDSNEPDRKTEQVFAADCKEFIFEFHASKNMHARSKVYRFDPITRYKMIDPNPGAIKYSKNKMHFTWQAYNVGAYEAYRFEW